MGIILSKEQVENDGKLITDKQLEEIKGRVLHTSTTENQIHEMLRERGSRYGDYETHAIITQNLLSVLQHESNYHKLPQHMKETIHMICHKLGRIVNGDPKYLDSWIDIIGYTQLTIDILKIQEKLKEDQEPF